MNTVYAMVAVFVFLCSLSGMVAVAGWIIRQLLRDRRQNAG